MRKRVVITGMGAVTPIGVGLVQFWEGLLEGRCGIGPITQFDPGDYPCRIAAEVLDFDRSRFFERHATRVPVSWRPIWRGLDAPVFGGCRLA